MVKPAQSVYTVKKHLTKGEIEARKEAEAKIFSDDSKPRPNEIVQSNNEMMVIFNQLSNLNEYYTEADSISLNTLVFNLYLKFQNEQYMSSLDISDDNYERFIIRLEKFNKQINESMKQLCIPLSNRLSLANDMAKIMIEEKKLEKMKEQNKQEVNPLLSLLEDDDE
ncbi:hypothetical protein ACMG4J_02520 [Rossellomorea marisflavi]|uniref:hypothetical protein n=1 Tax=Rossellomorea marisflavi TaxID=189381 RepID=UPI0039BF017C